jgi:hypothetical protein
MKTLTLIAAAAATAMTMAMAAAAAAAADTTAVPASTLIKPPAAGGEVAPGLDGFLRRWLILEPIPSPGLTENTVQAAVKKEYFPNQFGLALPRDGEKVRVNEADLTWHAVETKNYNVNLFHFARSLQ